MRTGIELKKHYKVYERKDLGQVGGKLGSRIKGRVKQCCVTVLSNKYCIHNKNICKYVHHSFLITSFCTNTIFYLQRKISLPIYQPHCKKIGAVVIFPLTYSSKSLSLPPN